MIVFTPLCGSAQSSSIPTAFCYLLQIDDIRVLLDCGAPDWRLGAGEDVKGQDELANQREAKKLWSQYLELLARNAPEIDLVLFTHGSLQHIGLYAYARAKLGLTAPAFATLPVQALGRIAALEDVEGWRAEVDVDNEPPQEYSPDGDVKMEDGAMMLKKAIATAEEVKEAFDSITTLKYSQATHLTGKLQALTLTAHSAAHTLGGTLWKLRSASSGTLLYAVGLNHMKEQHLDGTTLVRPGGGGVGEGLGRPDLLITDAQRVGVISVRRREREEAFLESITKTLRASGSILIPVDASTRLIELLVILDQHWTQAKTRAPLCLVSRSGKECIAFVRSLMEWMGGWITREGEVPTLAKDGKKRKRKVRRDEEDIEDEDALLANMILRFRHLQIFPTVEALMAAIPAGTPKVILATPLTMSHGASRALFETISHARNNLLLLVNIAEKGTLARSMWDWWEQEQAEDSKWGKGRLGNTIHVGGKITLTVNAKVPLTGSELEEYLEAEKAAREKAAADAAAARPQRLLEADDDDEEDSEDEASDASSELAVEEELGRGTGEGIMTRPFAEGAVGAKAAGPEEDDVDSARQQLSFDIYLKGKVARATFFRSSSGPQATRYRMFPYVEKRRRIDAWGETIDVGTWMRKGKQWEEEEETEENQEVREAKRKQREEAEAQKAPPEPPSKFVTEEHVLELRCKVFFVDFEGLNDGRATKMIIPQVNPRKMILVAAEPKATTELIEACGEIRSMTREISTPTVGEDVKIGEHTHSYSISIGEALFSTLKMSKFEDNEVAFVSGRIAFNANSAIPVLEPSVPAKASEPTATKQAASSPDQQKDIATITPQILPQTTLIGDLRLTALKARLSALGVTADFAGEGVLICSPSQGQDASDNDIVSVRKMGRGRVEVEGNISDVYYTVRKELYGLYAQVAG